MWTCLLKSKIHRVKTRKTNLNYEGSIIIDQNLLNQAQILIHEKVHVLNLRNGSRFETYVIAGKPSSGIISVQGPASHLVNVGDLLIILSYGFYTEKEIQNHQPQLVFVDENNGIK